MKLNTLHDLLVHQLKDLLFAEKHVVKTLPKMAKAAADPDLQAAFLAHGEESREHVARLEECFRHLEIAPRPQKCPAILGLIEEGDEFLNGDHDDAVRDAGLIASAQRVEHYEIAGYGCARAFAKRLGYREVERLLTQTIDEEGAADKKLTQLAERGINDAAAEPETNDDAEAVAARAHSNGRAPKRRRATQRA